MDLNVENCKEDNSCLNYNYDLSREEKRMYLYG